MIRIAMACALATMTTAADAQDTADLKFSYTYPAQVRAIPALKGWLDQQAAALRTKMAADAAADRRDAAKDGRPFNPYEAQRTWKVVTDTPRFLSLSLDRYEYTGGAHGMGNYSALVYDRQTGDRRTPSSFFASDAALRAAIRPAFCRQLDAERRVKRKGDDGPGLPEFNQCIDPVKETVILGSSTRGGFDRIGILIAPYDAGPYAEGSYDVTLPVTPAVLAAVRPEWRRYFKLAGTP